MQIFKLDTSRKSEARKFVRFPFQLYHGSPYWVPPMLSDAYRQVDRQRNPFFLHSDADFFLAQEGDEIVGRIVAMENRNYNTYHQKKCGFFYLFDAIDDQNVADGLFGAAFDWCRQRGLERIIGPKGFNVFEGYGMLYKGFDYLPAMSIPYNYDYYCQLVENVGLEKEVDFTSFLIQVATFEMPERVIRLAEKVEQRRGLQVKKFTSKAELKAIVPAVIAAYNDTFVENWEYVPVTPEEGAVAAAQMLLLLRPEMAQIIIKDEKIVGFLLAFLNISKAIQKCQGRLFPLGWYYLLREMRRTTLVDVNGMGILEEYRGTGGNVILYKALYDSLVGRQFIQGEMVQMADFVGRMLADAHTLGGEPHKVHRVYRKILI